MSTLRKVWRRRRDTRFATPYAAFSEQAPARAACDRTWPSASFSSERRETPRLKPERSSPGGGEGIRTLDTSHPVYTISSRAPSTSSATPPVPRLILAKRGIGNFYFRLRTSSGISTGYVPVRQPVQNDPIGRPIDFRRLSSVRYSKLSTPKCSAISSIFI